jgi:hypothetical protein
MSDTIKDKIRKLLAKANDTSVGVEEAKLFNDKAHELMVKHNLNRALLDEGQANKTDARTHKEFTTLVRPYSTAIIAGITKLYYCKWFYRSAGRKHTVVLIGEESNVAVCHMICVMVLRAVEQESRRTGGGRSFMTGAAQVISRRCAEMYQSTHATLPANASPAQGQLSRAQSGALVVLDQSEAAQNQRYMEQTLGIAKLRSVQSKARVGDAGAYGAGRRFGETVNLRSNLIGKS